MELQQAPPELKIFFEKLLKLKESINAAILCDHSLPMQFIYEKLDEIIKDGDEIE